MDRRRFLKTAAGLFVPAAPALILPKWARAQGGMMPGPGTVHSIGSTFSLDFTGNAEDGTSQTTYTFTSVPIGAANANRVVGIGFWWRSTNDTDVISGVTIDSGGGAVACSQASGAKVIRADGDLNLADIWYLAVASGTIATVAVTLSVAGLRCGMSAYRIITTTPTPNNGTFGIDTSPNFETATSGTLTIPGGGAGFAMYGERNALGSGITWTNATKDYQAEIPVAAGAVSSAKVTATNAITAVGNVGGGGACCVSCAAWGP